MEPKEFTILFKRLCALVSRYAPDLNADPTVIKTWYDILTSDFNADQIRLGFKLAIESCKAFPTYAEFRELCISKNGISMKTAIVEATNEIVDSLQRGGRGGLGELARDAWENLGGWSVLGQWECLDYNQCMKPSYIKRIESACAAAAERIQRNMQSNQKLIGPK